MEIIEKYFELEDKNLTHANYIFFNLDKHLPKNKYGSLLEKIKLKNGKSYILVIESNTSEKEKVINYYSPESECDLDTIREFFINGNQRFLKFKNEAYFRVINLEDDSLTKYFFSDYNDAKEYIKNLDDHSSSIKS